MRLAQNHHHMQKLDGTNVYQPVKDRLTSNVIEGKENKVCQQMTDNLSRLVGVT